MASPLRQGFPPTRADWWADHLAFTLQSCTVDATILRELVASAPADQIHQLWRELRSAERALGAVADLAGERVDQLQKESA